MVQEFPVNNLLKKQCFPAEQQDEELNEAEKTSGTGGQEDGGGWTPSLGSSLVFRSVKGPSVTYIKWDCELRQKGPDLHDVQPAEPETGQEVTRQVFSGRLDLRKQAGTN